MRAGLPPSDLDRYQIHMPLPSNALGPDGGLPPTLRGTGFGGGETTLMRTEFEYFRPGFATRIRPLIASPGTRTRIRVAVRKRPPTARAPMRPPARERTGKTTFARRLMPPAPTSSLPVRVTTLCDVQGNGSDEQRTKTIRGWPLRGAEASAAGTATAADASARRTEMRMRAAIIEEGTAAAGPRRPA